MFLSIEAQSIEFNSGLNLTKFYDTHNDVPYNQSTYTSDLRSYFGFGIGDITIDSVPFYLSISYESYGGSAKARTGGLGGGTSTRVKLKKSIFSLGIHRLNRSLYKGLNINLGIIFSVLLSESFSGNVTKSAGNSPITTDLQEEFDSFNSSVYLGIQGRISYDIEVSENIVMFPHYIYYLGILNEFKEFPKSIKSMRHSFGIGLKMWL